MSAQSLPSPRFIRKTQLAPGEYRKNFHQIDRDIIAVVTSAEADRVSPLMSKIYLRLVNAPDKYWERDGVLRIEAEVRGERVVKAWAVLCELVGVASATASKAMRWLHEQGIIGYFAGKNGVGVRIFLNRAVASIGLRATSGGQKILTFPLASSVAPPASTNEPAFNDSYAVSESLETDINSRAPKNGADSQQVVNNSPEPQHPVKYQPNVHTEPAPARTFDTTSLADVVMRLRVELEPAIHTAARQAAAREHERTRAWLEQRGLPKAARVAQHEAYNVLRQHGVISAAAHGRDTQAEVGRNELVAPIPQALAQAEIAELAGACVALFETRGQTIELTLTGMSAANGGFLLPADAERVRAEVNTLLSTSKDRQGK